ncbi:PREDICTED: F-box/FBD/LRR-repeat protein At1g13570-like isoform X2 [Ipomoea nil]|uniref:F-box/FBD/LRR-repeat protein At1g13570-like isoform X2 n=1 Tax=Ipomoea nil TaxID=35883 RepID=UPI000900E265|nr:PREDICTED: F-box/FBD/LRR-repeat protein At1g13570-like isoform X2 [Ipomoea nil]
MVSCSRRKLEADARRDVMSELPANVKEMILERLPTHEAARTSLLSTHWKDAWLRLGQLVFDSNFFTRVRKTKGYIDGKVPFVKIITYILLQRVGPVKKFTICINSLIIFDGKLQQSDLDQWYLFLSRNGVEELHISHHNPWERHYKLPFCIVLCPTIKQLRFQSLGFDCPIYAPSNFPCFSSLAFRSVVFNHNANGIVSTLPNLEKLDFRYCQGICNFKIKAPKLESLSITSTDTGPSFGVESRWFAPHLKAIKALCLEASLLLWEEDVEVASFPTAINLQVIKLHSFDFANEKQLMGVLQLLQKSPNLCELDIKECLDDDIEAFSRLLKDPDSCIINQDLKMLKTIKIEQFCGCAIEMLFVKMLLSKSPILERVIIMESYYINDGYIVIKILRELLCFPRASPKAKIVIKGKVYL